MADVNWKGLGLTFGASLMGSVLGVGALLSVISFDVSTAQVAALGQGVAVALSNIDGTMGRIEGRLASVDTSMNELRVNVVALQGDMEVQAKDIASISERLEKTMSAVRDYGINIQATVKGIFSPSDMLYTTTWDEVRQDFGVSGDEPLFLQLPAPSRP